MALGAAGGLLTSWCISSIHMQPGWLAYTTEEDAFKTNHFFHFMMLLFSTQKVAMTKRQKLWSILRALIRNFISFRFSRHGFSSVRRFFTWSCLRIVLVKLSWRPQGCHSAGRGKALIGISSPSSEAIGRTWPMDFQIFRDCSQKVNSKMKERPGGGHFLGTSLNVARAKTARDLLNMMMHRFLLQSTKNSWKTGLQARSMC